MKFVIFFLILILSNHSFAGSEEWSISARNTICSMGSYDSIEINDTQLVHFNLSFAVTSKDHNIGGLRDIGIKPNEFIMQMIVTLHKQTHTLPPESFGSFGFAETEIKEPLQVLVNGKALNAYESEYGISFNLSGEEVKNHLDSMANNKNLEFQVQSKSVGKTSAIVITNKNFMLNYHLLKACAAYFV